MKETLKVEVKQEVLSLVSGVAFSTVPAWYEGTYRDLRMDLIIPKHRENHKPCPAFVFVCGGAYMVVDHSIWRPQFVMLAKAGYVVAAIEYRTSNEAHFPAQLEDAKSAVRYLRAHAEEYCIDPGRIFISGESAGGCIASLVGVTGGQPQFDKGGYLEYSSAVQGVVNFYGPAIVSDLGGGCNTNEDVPDWTFRAYLGVYSGDGNEQMKAASATTYINEDTPPFLLLQGTGDALVPKALTDRFYDALVEGGVRTDYIVVDGAGHGDDAFYQEEVLKRVMDFMESI